MNIDEPLARIAADGAVRYYHADALGSIIALTDESGAIKTQYSYSPFGLTREIGEASGNPFKFTGREHDETGLYYYRARYYSPEMGRFLSEDPIRFAAGDVNWYAYVGNRPTNLVDPLGLFRVLVGVGGSVSPIRGVEKSAGLVFGLSEVSKFTATGHSAGFNMSTDVFAGFVRGDAGNLSGESTNVNLVIGAWSFTLLFSEGNFLGATVGWGPGVPVGASVSFSETDVSPLTSGEPGYEACPY